MAKFYSNWFQALPKDSIREHIELSQKYRNDFQIDRDRILYSKSFRRLSGKTQIFLTGNNDHLRSRLTHSLEVNQIAKTIGYALNLNLDLIEAIAFGHDIGHTPFGHIGERTLNFIMNGCEDIKEYNKELPESEKGFKHNLQALRVLSYLERNNLESDGLNISFFTLWGILNHTSYEPMKCSRDTIEKPKGNEDTLCFYNHIPTACKQSGKLSLRFYERYIEMIDNEKCWTLEGLIVKLADEIAQRHHDIEDAIYANITHKEEVLEIFYKTFEQYFDKQTKDIYKQAESVKTKELTIAYLSRLVVNFLVTKAIIDINYKIRLLTRDFQIKSKNDFINSKVEIYKRTDVNALGNYLEDFSDCESKFHNFLKNKILNSYTAQKMDGKAEFIIRKLFEAFVNNPQQMPDKTIIFFYNNFFGSDSEELKKIKKVKDIGGLRGDLKINFERNSTYPYRWALLRTICDYIAGMTDNYAYNQYELLYGSTRIYQ